MFPGFKILVCVTKIALFASQSGKCFCPARYLTGQETSVQLTKSLHCSDFSDLFWAGKKLECG